MRKARENKNYSRVIDFKDCFVREATITDGMYHETNHNINGNEIIISSRLDEEEEFIQIFVTSVLNEVPYTQEYMIDFREQLQSLGDKESSTFSMNENIGANILGLLQCNDIEFKQNGNYGLSSEWLTSIDNDLFNIGFNIADNGKAYLKFFKLRHDDKEEDVIEDEKSQIKNMLESWL